MKYIYILLILLGLTACGGGSRFTVEGEIEGLQDQGLTVLYLNSGLKKYDGHAEQSKFKFVGSSDHPTMVEIYSLQGELLATFIAQNGDKIKIKGRLGFPLEDEITGNDATEKVGDFIKQNKQLIDKKDYRALNAKIATYIKEHPDTPASSLVMMTLFHSPGSEAMGASLLGLLTEKGKIEAITQSLEPLLMAQKKTLDNEVIQGFTVTTALHNGRDSAMMYIPDGARRSLLVFTTPQRGDTVPRELKKVAREVKIYEVTLGGDSAQWRGMIRGDSATWRQGWLPGGTGNGSLKGLQIPRLPFFIATDSTGHPLYRGSGMMQAIKAIAPSH